VQLELRLPHHHHARHLPDLLNMPQRCLGPRVAGQDRIGQQAIAGDDDDTVPVGIGRGWPRPREEDAPERPRYMRRRSGRRQLEARTTTARAVTVQGWTVFHLPSTPWLCTSRTICYVRRRLHVLKSALRLPRSHLYSSPARAPPALTAPAGRPPPSQRRRPLPMRATARRGPSPAPPGRRSPSRA
jgi:hypothetical protein